MQCIFHLLLALKDLADRAPDELGRLSSVNGRPDAGLAVVFDDGAGLLRLSVSAVPSKRDTNLVVGSQTLLERLGVVIRTLDEGLASDVIDHVLLRRVD